MQRGAWLFMCSKLLKGSLITVIGAGMIGCANNTENGALIGGAGGAVAGGAIGSVSHSRAGEGALIGAAVGAIGGALVGNSIDQSDQKNNNNYAERDYDRRHSSGEEVRKSDVIAWTYRGLSDDVIIDRIERSGAVFHLTAADENDLRDRGVSETVIRVMRDTSR
jgi:uncharacterized protein YcfJ